MYLQKFRHIGLKILQINDRYDHSIADNDVLHLHAFQSEERIRVRIWSPLNPLLHPAIKILAKICIIREKWITCQLLNGVTQFAAPESLRVLIRTETRTNETV